MTISLSVYPPLPTLDETIYKYTTKIDAVVSARLLNGFDWQPPVSAVPADILALFNNEVPTFRFSTKMSDQLNITQAAVLAGQALAMGNMEWKRSWQGWYQNTQYTLLFNLQDWASFADAYANAKDGCLTQGWMWKSKLRAQTTTEDVEAMFKSFGISEQEITDAEAMVDATL